MEEIIGQPIEAYLQEHILDPPGMTNSGSSAVALAPIHAMPYERIEGDYFVVLGQQIPVPDHVRERLERDNLQLPLYEHPIGATVLRTTVVDLAQFVIAHMNGGCAPNGYQLLERETAELAQQRAVKSTGNISRRRARDEGSAEGRRW